MRRGIAQVVDGQRDQRLFERPARVQQPHGESVGLVLVPARKVVHNRPQPECKRSGDQGEDHQRGVVRGLVQSEGPEQGRVFEEHAEHPQPGEQEQGAQAEVLEHVAHLVVAHLVGQHGQELRPAQLLQQRVEQDDALGLAQPGEIGVGVAGPFRPVHGEDAAGAEPDPPGQLRDGVPQRAVRHRLEAVEERRDEGGVEHQHQGLEREDENEDVHPPPGPGNLHEPQHAVEKRRPEHHGQHDSLEPVGDEGAGVGLVESEAFLEHEGGVDFERQRQEREEPAHAEAEEDAGGLGHGNERPGPSRQPVHPRQHPAEQDHQSQHRATGSRPAREAPVGFRVTYRFLVGFLADSRCQDIRQPALAPLPSQVAHVGFVEQGLDGQLRQEEGQEQSGDERFHGKLRMAGRCALMVFLGAPSRGFNGIRDGTPRQRFGTPRPVAAPWRFPC